MLQIKNLTKSYDRKIFDYFNIDIGNGVTVIMGKSGIGKTTLLRCIAGLEKFEKGSIIKKTNNIGIVFQDFNLWETLSVKENIILAPKLKKKKYDLNSICKKLNIVNILNKYPNQLSGGEKQRVAIARTLITNPDLILLDEITSSLDKKNVKEIEDIIKKLSKENKSMIVVTHNIEFAKSIADKIVDLNILNKNK
jgi:polar amino acid transport system ATP-binding protein